MHPIKKLSLALLALTLTANAGTIKSPSNKPVHVTPGPAFVAKADQWNKFESSELLGQPVTFWEYKSNPLLKIIHYKTWQNLEKGDDWAGVLKKNCSLLLPQLSAALATNIAPAKDAKIGSLPACMMRIPGFDKTTSDHYIFVWRSADEKDKGVYQGHTVTVTYPPNFLAQGHEAVEGFLKTLVVPEGAK
jgi:hypothetical protein